MTDVESASTSTLRAHPRITESILPQIKEIVLGRIHKKASRAVALTDDSSGPGARYASVLREMAPVLNQQSLRRLVASEAQVHDIADKKKLRQKTIDLVIFGRALSVDERSRLKQSKAVCSGRF